MPVTTLRKWLSTPNPVLFPNKNLKPSFHSTESENEPVDAWSTWEDFTFTNINALFGVLLDQQSLFPELPEEVPAALRIIGSERDLGFVVMSWNVSIVNAALRVVAESLTGPNSAHLLWSAGSAAGILSRFPDWAAILSDSTTLDRPSLAPGETKMFPTEFPTECANANSDTGDPTGKQPARKCLEQILGYASDFNTRYCWIITPHDLVLIRRSNSASPPSSEAAAATRTTRSQLLSTQASTSTHGAALHSHGTSLEPSTPPTATRTPIQTPIRMPIRTRNTPSQVRGSPRTPVPSSSSSMRSVYVPSEDMGHMAPPEVVGVSWMADPNKEMTVNLAMFAILSLATISRDVRTGYAPIHEDQAYRSAFQSG
ncbi:uncharacterized protein LTHEOB_11345 [Neofusicoccum parvum]|nr:uncharacterized protein LTHEOB_11345 [Neofusicoccum parvum]